MELNYVPKQTMNWRVAMGRLHRIFLLIKIVEHYLVPFFR